MAVVGVVTVVLFAGACGGKEEPLGPTATVPQATTTTDPYAVPPVIDEAYVNRVLAGLDQVVGDAVRSVVRTRLLDEEVYYRLMAVSSGDAFQLKLDSLQRDLLGGMTGYPASPGNKVTRVTRLISIKISCIFAEVTKDFAALNSTGETNLSTEWVALVPLDPTRDTHSYNPTHWVFVYDGLRADESAPPDPCAAVP
jgi:hypothetical protein